MKQLYTSYILGAETRLRTQKDTIRVQGPLRKTLSGKQHPNLQDLRKTLGRLDTGFRQSVVAVLIQARFRDNRVIQILGVNGLLTVGDKLLPN